MADSNQRSHNYEVNTVIERILEQNPEIIPARIELFSEVYYPIAILELDMTETTFEDFDIVPLSVLKFIKGGMRSADDISRLMGLTKGYVQRVMDLLMGYGYIDRNGMLELGEEALRIEKKVGHAQVKQRFQADAITGDLLKIGEQPSEADLQGADKTFGVIPHMPHIEGISIDDINSQMRNEDLTKYKYYQGEILNANVDDIHSAVCVGLEYIKAYLVKLQGIDLPFVISYKYDVTQKEFKDRFSWQPMRMPGEKAYAEYGFSRDIPLYSDEALKMIDSLYKLVCKRIIEIDEEALKKLLGHIHPFDYDTMDITMGRVLSGVPEQISVYLNAASFTKWNPFVLNFLAHYDPVSGFLYTGSWLNGLFLRFESQNADIKRAAKDYRRALRHYDKRELNSHIRNRLFDENSGDFNISEITKAIEEYVKESE